jgi:DNA-binding transcriptional LysR family regulator
VLHPGRPNGAHDGFTRAATRPHLADGRLVRVLSDWCPKFSGYHLYYPSRRQPTPAFAAVVDALRYRR